MREVVGRGVDLGVAPRANLRRDTSSQRAHLPWAESVAAELARLAGAEDEEAARSLLESRLAWLREALLESPYYVRKLREAHMHPSDLRGLEDLRHFPRLERATFGQHWDELPVLPPESAECVVVRSSGSTGEPVRVVRDRRDCLHMWAVLRFLATRAKAVLPPRPRVVLLDALPGGLEYSVRLPILGDGALHRLSVLRADTLERLRRVKPAVVFSDPEGLRWLASQEGVPVPRLLLSSAQHLSEEQRRTLASVVPAPVVNYYATTETGPLAWECLEVSGRFHILAPDVWVEPGVEEVVVTRLRSGVLPLLRYCPGDAGTTRWESCGCGFRGWTLEGFGGRGACLFRVPGGREVDAWQVAWVFKHHALRAFRLTQVEPERFELELAGAEEEAPLRERLVAALRNLGWATPRVEMRHVTDEALSTGLKPQPFRSLLN